MKIMISAAILVASSMIAMAQNNAAFDLHYPDTRRVDQKDNYFGTDVPDPYRWLENLKADDTKAKVDKKAAGVPGAGDYAKSATGTAKGKATTATGKAQAKAKKVTAKKVKEPAAKPSK